MQGLRDLSRQGRRCESNPLFSSNGSFFAPLIASNTDQATLLRQLRSRSAAFQSSLVSNVHNNVISALGWHYDCLDPPLDGPPDGNWNCPLCPPLLEEEYNYEGEGEADEGEAEASGGEAEDEAAALTESEAIVQVAFTPRPKKKKGKTKSKSRPSITYRTPSSIKKTRLPHHGPGRPIGSVNK